MSREIADGTPRHSWTVGGLPARAVAFDVDAGALARLRETLPDWTIDAINEATPASLVLDWNPAAAQLLVVGAGEDAARTLGLCRFLSFCARYATDAREWDTRALRQGEHHLSAPLLVLLRPGHEAFAQAAVRAGADGHLLLPIDSGSVVSLLAHLWADNHRHNGSPDRTAIDRWNDDGGHR
jgi:hypothetical protein